MIFSVVDEEINKGDQQNDLHQRDDDRQHKADFCPVDDAGGRVPMPDGDEQRHRQRDPAKVNDGRHKGKNREAQRHVVVQHAMVFEASDFAFGTARFQAGRAKVLAVEFTIAQRTEKSAAAFARKNRFFLRMIETTRFCLLHQRLAFLARCDPAKQGGKNFNLQQFAAGRAGNQFGQIEYVSQQGRLAFGAGDQWVIHAIIGYL